MSDVAPRGVMFPFFRGMAFDGFPSGSIIYGRPSTDFQSDCLLFRCARCNAMSKDDIMSLRSSGHLVCYAYDMLDLENREFTEDGFLAISRDIESAIDLGFTHVMLSNAYVIELVLGEYASGIQTIISSLLECNSSRSTIFFDVLNDTSSISHVVFSQNHLTRKRLTALQKAFTGVQLIAEVDRWCSDIQMVHEHYYNMLYGYYSEGALAALTSFVNRRDIQAHVKAPADLFWSDPGLVYKVGEMNVSPPLCLANMEAALAGELGRMRLIDMEMWK